jgi:translation initiation factor IF-3
VKSNEKFRVNDQIKISPVVVIDQFGKNLGPVPLKAALGLATQHSLDLVEIAPSNRPPVCRIMDYGKFRFEQNVKEKKIKKNQAKSSKIKEIRLSPSIQEYDMETKIKSAIKMLQSGHKINVRLEFKRRQIVHQELGIKIMHSFLERISDFGKMMAKPKSEGRIVFCVVEPPSTENGNAKIV